MMKKNFEALVEYGKLFYGRGWMWGTSGNLSTRMNEWPNPLEIEITPSGVNKGDMKVEDLITVYGDGLDHADSKRKLRPSAETLIHQAIYNAVPDARAVFHVHPIYTTLISGLYGDAKKPKRFPVDWIEMLKGINVQEGETAEFIVLPNFQTISLVATDVTNYIQSKDVKVLPAVLIYNHGLTAWGRSMDEALNHLEVIEYVCNYLYLKLTTRPSH